MSPLRLYHISGPAACWRVLCALARPATADHAALVAARVARLGLLDEAGLLTWTHGGRSVKADAARLMRAVAEEVEG